MTEVETVARKVMTAKCAEDVFGDVRDDAGLTKAFRALARVLHPDHAGRSKEAGDAMARLLTLRDQGERKLADGTWGKKSPLVTAEIYTSRAYLNLRPLAGGDLADVYLADMNGEKDSVAIKLFRDPRDNDLATAEWRNLERLWKEKTDSAANFQRYLPKQLETAKVEVGGKVRRANIFRYVARAHTLAEVMAARPGGIDPRDMAWMWRRVLELMSWVHSKGIVHGAILPEHVLIRPEDHGAVLVGWSCSVAAGDRIKAISTARRDWYAPEVVAKQPATPSTDVFMAARTIAALVDRGSLPRKIDALLSACLLHNPRARHPAAADVYARFDKVLRELYGPPSFKPFSLLPA